jgi:acyl-CoA thioesterase
MQTFGNIEEAKKYFEGDKFATLNGMVLDELDESHSLCSLALEDRHKNANGGIMGGVMFTLADFAFAAIVNNIHLPTVAQQVSINYLSAPKGKKLFAIANILKNGKTTIVANVNVYDDTGRAVALFTGTGFKL